MADPFLFDAKPWHPPRRQSSKAKPKAKGVIQGWTSSRPLAAGTVKGWSVEDRLHVARVKMRQWWDTLPPEQQAQYSAEDLAVMAEQLAARWAR